MLSTGESVNVGLSQVVQLFAPHANPALLLAQKISFINFEKKLFLGADNVHSVSIRVSFV